MLLLPVLLAACNTTSTPATQKTEPVPVVPPSVAPAIAPLAKVAGIDESSGVGWAREAPGVWITHNDSGDGPVLYRFDLNGALLESRPIQSASALDWEDLSIGPCPGAQGSCVYAADFGDNDRARRAVNVYAIPESGDAAIAAWRYSYPEGPLNAEALLVHPTSGRLYVVSKDKTGRSGVFRLPAEPGEAAGVAERVASLQFDGPEKSWRYVTGGDWSPDGTRIALRTYEHVYVWQVDPDAPEAHWGSDPIRCDLPDADRKGEAIAWTPEGDLLTTSEGDPMVVYRLRCPDAPEAPSPDEGGQSP